MFDIIAQYIPAIIFANVCPSVTALFYWVYQEKVGEPSVSYIIFHD